MSWELVFSRLTSPQLTRYPVNVEAKRCPCYEDLYSKVELLLQLSCGPDLQLRGGCRV